MTKSVSDIRQELSSQNGNWYGTCCERLAKQLSDAIQEGMDYIEVSYADMFVEIGWFPSVHIACTTIGKVEEHCNANDYKRAERFVRKFALRIYNEELINATLSSWKENELLSSRIHILEEAIKAHNAKMYFASVVLLVSQIEGIVFESLGQKGKTTHADLKKALGKKEKFSIFADSLRKYAERFLYTQFSWGDSSDSTLNRNAIMHGSNVSYGTRVNSIKALMLIDLIQYVLKLSDKASKEEEKVLG